MASQGATSLSRASYIQADMDPFLGREATDTSLIGIEEDGAVTAWFTSLRTFAGSWVCGKIGLLLEIATNTDH